MLNLRLLLHMENCSVCYKYIKHSHSCPEFDVLPVLFKVKTKFKKKIEQKEQELTYFSPTQLVIGIPNVFHNNNNKDFVFLTKDRASLIKGFSGTLKDVINQCLEFGCSGVNLLLHSRSSGSFFCLSCLTEVSSACDQDNTMWVTHFTVAFNLPIIFAIKCFFRTRYVVLYVISVSYLPVGLSLCLPVCHSVCLSACLPPTLSLSLWVEFKVSDS